tara:strand:+ start:375 stop:665 length:291 start_codon:yes stop_codon:yes gene_type:complete
MIQQFIHQNAVIQKCGAMTPYYNAKCGAGSFSIAQNWIKTYRILGCHNGVHKAQSINIHILRQNFKTKERSYSMRPKFAQLTPAEQQNFGNGVDPD